MCKTHTTISNYFINKSHFAFPLVNHIHVFVGGRLLCAWGFLLGRASAHFHVFPFVPLFPSSFLFCQVHFAPNWSLDAPGGRVHDLVSRATLLVGSSCSMQFDVVSLVFEHVWPLKKIFHITKWTFVPLNFLLPPPSLICTLERQGCACRLSHAS